MIEILAALAVARVSVFIVRERAPFSIMEKIREFVGASTLDEYNRVKDLAPNKYDADIIAKAITDTKPRFYELAYLLSCVWCVSFWVALAACWLLDFPLWYSLPFSAVAIFYDEKL